MGGVVGGHGGVLWVPGRRVEGSWILVRVMRWGVGVGVGVDQEAVLEGPDASVVAPVGTGFNSKGLR